MPEAQELKTQVSALRRRLWRLFTLFSVAVIAGSWAFYRYYVHVNVVREKSELLTSVGDFKLAQITDWRADRLSDTSSLLDSPILRIYLNRFLNSPSDAEAAELLRKRLDFFIKHNSYSVAALTDPAGKVMLRTSAGGRLAPETLKTVEAASRSGVPEMSDLFLHPGTGRPALAVAARVENTGKGRGVFLAMEADPENFLYPIVKRWPIKSATAETLLVRREGGEILYLNELRHRSGTALRLPVHTAALTSAMGVAGFRGIARGTDYRGQYVLADIRPVPGTGWVMVNKMDMAEALAGIWLDYTLIALLVMALLAATGAGAHIIFRLQAAAYARSYTELDRETAKLKLNYQHLSEQASDAIVLTNAETLEIVEANNRAAEMYGYTKEQLAGMKLPQLIPPDTLRDQHERLEYARAHPGATTEGLHMRSGGGSFPVEISSAFIEIDGREHVYSIIRDISGRKKAERELRDSEENYRQLFEAESDSIFLIDNSTGRILQANGAAEAMYGYSRAELLTMRNTDLSAEPEATQRITSGTPVSPETVISIPRRMHRRKDGRAFAVELTGRFFIKDGRPVHVVAARDITPRLKTEAELKEKERRISTLMSNLPGIAYRCRNDDKWTMEFISDACAAITGYEAEDFIGNRLLSFSDLILPQYRKAVWDTTQAALEEKRPFQLVYRIRRRDGAVRDILEQGKGIWNEDGTLAALEGYIADVTEKKALEETVLRNRELMEAVGEMAHIGGWEFDPETKTNNWSEQLYRIHDADGTFQPDAESILKIYGEAAVKQSIELMDRAITSGESFDIEVKAVTLKGRNRIFRVIGRPQTMPDGRMKVWGATQDVTDMKMAEQALKTRVVALTQPLDSADISFEDMFDMDELQKLQDAFSDATGVASLITLPDGKPLTRPSNFCDLCIKVIRGTEKGLCNCMHSDALIGRQNFTGPIMQRCMSGGLWDGGASITVGGRHVANWLVGQVKNEACDEEKMLQYAREIGADEVKFKEAMARVPVMSSERFAKVCNALFLLSQQLSLKAYQNILQARVITARLEAEKKAERLNAELLSKNQEMESYLYISSHDLRSPLVNIQGFAESIAKYCAELRPLAGKAAGDDPAGARYRTLIEERLPEAVGFVTSSSAKMDSLINGLLKISRLGRVEMRTEDLDMEKLAAEVVKSATFQLREAKAEVCLGALPPCRGDRTQLSQVLSNLIDNALKYRDPARPLRVDMSGLETGRGTVEYTVRDNGRGITEEQAAKVWLLFYRADPRGEVKGDGLGLTIMKRIIDRHGGRVKAGPAPGGGAQFVFELQKAEGRPS